MSVKGAVEALLYSSAESLSIQDIAGKLDSPVEEVRLALFDLIRAYGQRDTAIMIAKLGRDYRMMLRPEYAEYADRFGESELPAALRKTLSTIAYNQPVLQSDLFRTRGSRTYDDVKALMESGFVSGKRSGQTLELTTTKKFAEYFGIGSTRKEDIRTWIERNSRDG